MASYKMKQVSENSQQKMQKELAVLLSSLKEKKKPKDFTLSHNWLLMYFAPLLYCGES